MLNAQAYTDNLLGGLAMHLAGPQLLRLAFHIFVVVVGVLILSGAVNTSMIGANGVLNRVAEDHVLTPWFRKPHRKFGTSYRLINLIALLQLATILWSRGDVILLGEAYAFGVVWSFFLKALGVLVLRFKRHDQEYKTPLNITIGGREYPIGLAITTLTLLFVALANLFSKQIATISGVGFTLAMFIVFTISERRISEAPPRTRRKDWSSSISRCSRKLPANRSMRGRRAFWSRCATTTSMVHLHNVLEKTNLRRHDIVVMTVRSVSTGAGEYELGQNQLFTDYERELFTRVVAMAEKEGKTVDLLVVPGVNPFDAMVQAASKLQASRLVTGVSARMDSEELARRIGKAWEKLPEPRHPFSLEIITPGRPFDLCEPGAASAAAVAGRRRPRARNVAGSQRPIRRVEGASSRYCRCRAPPHAAGPPFPGYGMRSCTIFWTNSLTGRTPTPRRWPDGLAPTCYVPASGHVWYLLRLAMKQSKRFKLKLREFQMVLARVGVDKAPVARPHHSHSTL